MISHEVWVNSDLVSTFLEFIVSPGRGIRDSTQISKEI